jgi:hypothetical protein
VCVGVGVYLCMCVWCVCVSAHIRKFPTRSLVAYINIGVGGGGGVGVGGGVCQHIWHTSRDASHIWHTSHVPRRFSPEHAGHLLFLKFKQQ